MSLTTQCFVDDVTGATSSELVTVHVTMPPEENDGRYDPDDASPSDPSPNACCDDSQESAPTISRSAPVARSLDYLLGSRSAAAPDPYDRAVVKQLEDKTLRFLELLNARDFTSPDWREIFDDNFHSSMGPSPIKTREQLVQYYQNYALEHPMLQAEMREQSVEVASVEGRASVWVCVRNRGTPFTIQLTNISRIIFERKDDGRWLAIKHDGIRGPGSI